VSVALAACGPALADGGGAGRAALSRINPAPLVQEAVQAAGQRLGQIKTPAIDLREVIRQISPAHLVRTARTNTRHGRFYATDLTVHPSRRAALLQSLAPVDLKGNVRAAFWTKVHPIRFLGNIFDPLTIELSRQIVSGRGLDPGRLIGALHPAVVGATMIGGGAGDIAGAIAQSALARLGPAGAAAGFFLRPAMAFGGQILGMGIGESLAGGDTFGEALAGSLRTIRPGRDGGQLLGGVVGGTLGQVLIPIPVVGGIIGGIVGATLGGLLGNAIARIPGVDRIERAVTGWLGRLADRLEGRRQAGSGGRDGAAPAGSSPAAGPPPDGPDAGGTAVPSSVRRVASADRVGRADPIERDAPNMDDLPAR
jgi:hypothetical protein